MIFGKMRLNNFVRSIISSSVFNINAVLDKNSILILTTILKFITFQFLTERYKICMCMIKNAISFDQKYIHYMINMNTVLLKFEQPYLQDHSLFRKAELFIRYSRFYKEGVNKEFLVSLLLS